MYIACALVTRRSKVRNVYGACALATRRSKVRVSRSTQYTRLSAVKEARSSDKAGDKAAATLPGTGHFLDVLDERFISNLQSVAEVSHL